MNNERIEKRSKELKSLIENLELQFHLGKSEAKEEFEKQKKNLLKWVDGASEKLRVTKDLSEEQIENIRTSLESLRVQLALGKAETEDQLKEQETKLKRSLEQLRSDMDLVFKTTTKRSDNFLEDASLLLHDYQIRLDILRVQMHLAKAETAQELEEKKRQARLKLAEIRTELNKKAEDASEQWDHFSEEMLKAWGHVKKAFD